MLQTRMQSRPYDRANTTSDPRRDIAKPGPLNEHGAPHTHGPDSHDLVNAFDTYSPFCRREVCPKPIMKIDNTFCIKCRAICGCMAFLHYYQIILFHQCGMNRRVDTKICCHSSNKKRIYIQLLEYLVKVCFIKCCIYRLCQKIIRFRRHQFRNDLKIIRAGEQVFLFSSIVLNKKYRLPFLPEAR